MPRDGPERVGGAARGRRVGGAGAARAEAGRRDAERERQNYCVAPTPREKITATAKSATVSGAHEYAMVLDRAG